MTTDTTDTLYKRAQAFFPDLPETRGLTAFLQPFTVMEFFQLKDEQRRMILNSLPGEDRLHNCKN